MRASNNTILITGGGSGIGRALAEAFHAAGNQVIIAGRRQDALDATVAANPGMRAAVLDIADAQDIQRFAQHIKADFPSLNVVIHNAGIMRAESVLDGSLDVAEATVATNLLGPIRLNTALLPLLHAQPQATVMMVSSGLAFVPMAMTATYCATKAAIHSYAQSLRYQLKDTAVEVLELVPPYVQTGLMGERQATDPFAMPLQEFIQEVMTILHSPDRGDEICVRRVGPQRTAEASGAYATFYKSFNDAMAARA